MKLTYILPLLLLTGPLNAQQGNVSTDLTRARAAFNAADRNKDRQLNTREVGLAGIQPKEFKAADDGDGEWSWEEFLRYYRGLLTQSGQAVSKDLEQEVLRLAQVKKVKAAKGQGAEQGGGQSSTKEALRKKLNEAKGGITERAVSGGATRHDQRAVSGAVQQAEKRAQNAAGVAASGSSDGGSGESSSRTQRELLAGKIVDAQKTLQRVVAAGRLKPAEAREFYQVFLGRGVNALGRGSGGQTNGAVPTLRDRVTRLQGILQVHIDSGRVTPEEARNINGILEQRAREAAGVGQSGAGQGAGAQSKGAAEAAGGEAKSLREKLREAQRRLQQRQSAGGAQAGTARQAAESIEERARGAAGAAGATGGSGGSESAEAAPVKIPAGRVVSKKRLETPKPAPAPVKVPAPVKGEEGRTKDKEAPDQGRTGKTPG